MSWIFRTTDIDFSINVWTTILSLVEILMFGRDIEVDVDVCQLALCLTRKVEAIGQLLVSDFHTSLY